MDCPTVLCIALDIANCYSHGYVLTGQHRGVYNSGVSQIDTCLIPNVSNAVSAYQASGEGVCGFGVAIYFSRAYSTMESSNRV